MRSYEKLLQENKAWAKEKKKGPFYLQGLDWQTMLYREQLPPVAHRALEHFERVAAGGESGLRLGLTGGQGQRAGGGGEAGDISAFDHEGVGDLGRGLAIAAHAATDVAFPDTCSRSEN